VKRYNALRRSSSWEGLETIRPITPIISLMLNTHPFTAVIPANRFQNCPIARSYARFTTEQLFTFRIFLDAV